MVSGVAVWFAGLNNQQKRTGFRNSFTSHVPLCCTYERHTRNYHPALLLQTQNLYKTRLFYRGLKFLESNKLTIGDRRNQSVSTQSTTHSFIQFQFELLNDQQQHLLSCWKRIVTRIVKIYGKHWNSLLSKKLRRTEIRLLIITSYVITKF